MAENGAKNLTAAAIQKAPFPAFGGKSSISADAWRRLGDVRNYVEPFVFSAAMLLNRPQPFSGTETINDINGYVANFWRAVQRDPEAVAAAADSPVNENDLHAWHAWLVERKESLVAKLEGDPEFFDPLIAGKWCWGQCCWIGSGWCSGEGPWHVVEVDGARQLVHLGDAGRGVNRQLVHLGDAGRGVNRKLVHLRGAGRGVNRKLVHLGDAGQANEPEACGVSRKRPLITNDSVGVASHSGISAWMAALADRLRFVRVCCGDWSRVCGPTPTVKQGLTAVFFDPPYSGETGRAKVYGHTEDMSVAHDVRKWCLENGADKRLRICLAGYAGEHDELEAHGWDVFRWKARGGFGSQRADGANENAKRERLWFSPHCVKPERRLFQ
jgi:site-specific DNA-adenine methylase